MNEVVNEWINIIGTVQNKDELDKFLSQTTGYSLDYYLKKRDGLQNKVVDFNYENEEILELNEICDWYNLYTPIYLKYRRNLIENIGNLKFIAFENLIHEVDKYCIQESLNLSYRCVVQEINILRQKKELVGETSEDRYFYFCNSMCNDKNYVKTFFNKYPQLFELINLRMKQVTDFIIEICCNVNNENEELSNTFFDIENLELKNINFSLGDTHNNGKFVCVLNFDNNKKVIYKPRNMGIDCRLEELGNFISEKSNYSINIYTPKTIDKKDHGYASFICEESCEEDSEIKDYFKSIGYLLALLYILQSKDFHGENIITSREKPYLIDNETILHQIDTKMEYENCTEYIYSNIYKSVYGTGILPFSIYSSKNNLSMEVGTLNSGKERKSPFKTQEIINKKSDKIKIISKFKDITSVPSSPMLKNIHISCEEYLDDVIDGFTEFYKFILNIRKEFEGKIKELFNKEKARYIYRNTNTYAQLLETSRHPDLLKNEVDRYIYFLRLYTTINLSDKEELTLAKYELSALLNNDIPIFYLGCNNGLIYAENDNVVGRDINSSLINTLLEKIEKLDQEDLNNQLKIINMSFIGSGMTMGMKETSFDFNSINIEKLITNRLMDNAIKYKNELGWQALVGMGQGLYNIIPIDFSLYQGSSGVALILALSNKTQISDIDKIINYTLSNYKFLNSKKMGAFDGIFGILYSLANIYDMKLGLEDKIVEIIKRELHDINDQDRLKNLNNDIISGYAGILGVLITINDIFKDNKEIESISHILAIKVINNLKIKDINNTDIGYAHGNAGIIVQLYRYIKHFNVNEDDKIEINNIIRDMQELEKVVNNKYEIRENAKYYSWCNGIFGILLKNAYLDPEYHIPIEIEKDILVNGFGEDYSICHGDIGNLAILKNISNIEVDDNKIINNAVKKLFSIKDKYNYDDWGLMTGELSILTYYISNGIEIINRILCLEKLSVNNENKI